MPITTEEEPEDLDDDSPSRVSFLLRYARSWLTSVYSLLCASLTAFALIFPRHKFSRLSVISYYSISPLLILLIVAAPF